MERSNYWSEALESALEWWELAGVDVSVADAPRNWLKPSAAPHSGTPAAAPALPEPAPPVTIEALVARLADPQNFAELGGRRLAPIGNAGASLMLIVDMPESDDAETGGLLSGPPGRLLDAMLAAIGLDRAAVYIAPLAPARPPAGRLTAALEKSLGALALQHVALANPKAALILGDATTRALTRTSLAAARGQKLSLNHDGASVPAVATFHPRFLLQQPACKADAWADLRMLMEMITP